MIATSGEMRLPSTVGVNVSGIAIVAHISSSAFTPKMIRTI